MHDPERNVQPLRSVATNTFVQWIRLRTSGLIGLRWKKSPRTCYCAGDPPRRDRKGSAMSDRQTFSDSEYVDQEHIAERELSAFVNAVINLFGPEQARVAAEDWLEESELMDAPPRSTVRDWRSVTVAASARMANRVDSAEYRRKALAA